MSRFSRNFRFHRRYLVGLLVFLIIFGNAWLATDFWQYYQKIQEQHQQQDLLTALRVLHVPEGLVLTNQEFKSYGQIYDQSDQTVNQRITQWKTLSGTQ